LRPSRHAHRDIQFRITGSRRRRPIWSIAVLLKDRRRSNRGSGHCQVAGVSHVLTETSTRAAPSSPSPSHPDRHRFPSPAQCVLLVDGLPSGACGRLMLERWPPDPRHFPGVSSRQGCRSLRACICRHSLGAGRSGRFLASQGLYTPAHFWSMIDLFAVIT
jgi:hypothetical protein